MFFRDSIANTVSAIRVGYLARHTTVILPTTNHVVSVLSKLLECGAISNFKVLESENNKKKVEITLSYINGSPAISGIRLLSKKSNRFYITARALRRQLLTRRCIILLNTSLGVLSGYEACSKNIGGEPIILITC
jgi:small subunit ribosomal protein S8